MIYPNSVSNAIYTTISSDQTVINSGISIDLNRLQELDPNRMPWVGIYPEEINVEPHRVQRPNPWLVTYNYTMLVLNSRYNFNQEETQNELDSTLSVVLTAVNCNRTLGGSVDMLRGINITPFEQAIDQDNTLIGYSANLTYEVRR